MPGSNQRRGIMELAPFSLKDAASTLVVRETTLILPMPHPATGPWLCGEMQSWPTRIAAMRATWQRAAREARVQPRDPTVKNGSDCESIRLNISF